VLFDTVALEVDHFVILHNGYGRAGNSPGLACLFNDDVHRGRVDGLRANGKARYEQAGKENEPSKVTKERHERLLSAEILRLT
jgi:hypothetical protein